MNILAALPRIGNWSWPTAVAVSKAALLPSGADQTLIYVETGNLGAAQTALSVFEDAGMDATLRADMKTHCLYSVPTFVSAEDDAFKRLQSKFATTKIIGVLPNPIAVDR